MHGGPQLHQDPDVRGSRQSVAHADECSVLRALNVHLDEADRPPLVAQEVVKRHAIDRNTRPRLVTDVRAVIDVEVRGQKEFDRCRLRSNGGAHSTKLLITLCISIETRKVFGRRFEGVDPTRRSDTLGEDPRIESNVGTNVDYEVTGPHELSDRRDVAPFPDALVRIVQKRIEREHTLEEPVRSPRRGRRQSGEVQGLVVPFENPDNANFYYAALRSPVLRWLPTYSILLPLCVVGIFLSALKRRAISPLLPLVFTSIIPMTINLPMSRYRIALAAALCPFAGVALAQGVRWARDRHMAAIAVSGAAVAALFITARLIEQHVVFRNVDSRSIVYRMADFQIIALGYASQNRFREASEEYRQLAQLTPVPSVRAQAWLMAAQLHVRAGDAPAARRSLEALSGLAVDDAATLISTGDVWQALGEPGKALAAYRTAEARRPGGQLGKRLRERLARFPAAPQS